MAQKHCFGREGVDRHAKRLLHELILRPESGLERSGPLAATDAESVEALVDVYVRRVPKNRLKVCFHRV